MQRFIINQVILLGSLGGHARDCLKIQDKVRSVDVAVQEAMKFVYLQNNFCI